MSSSIVSIDSRGAQARLAPYIVRTPLLPSHTLSLLARRPILLKAENLQVTGAFKARGAMNRLLLLSAEERSRGIVTSSAGNHGQAVAWAAATLGIKATIVLPVDAVPLKIRRTQEWGAEVILSGRGYDEAHAYAERFVEERGATYIHAFEHPDVMAGQGTIAHEILGERPDVGTIVVPVGGGGLLCGVASAAAQHERQPRVVGVQSDATSAMHDALTAGHLLPVTTPPTLADGLAGGVSQETLDLCQALRVSVRLVPEETLLSAIALALIVEHLAIEGSAAVTIAAVMQHMLPDGDTPVALVLTGGNADPDVLRQAIETV